MNMQELQKKTVRELWAIAKDQKLKGYKKYPKDDLIELLLGNEIKKEVNVEAKADSNSILKYLKTLHRDKVRLLGNKCDFKNVNTFKKIVICHKLVEYFKLKNYSLEDVKNLLVGKITLQKEKIVSQQNEVIDMNFTNELRYIIHIADLHIRRNERIEEYQQVFNNFLSMIRDKYKQLKNKSIVVVCGDIFHYKTTQRAEGIKLWNKFLYELNQLLPSIVIMGNHDVDLTSNNIDWLEPFAGIYENNYYLNKSGLYQFNNVVFGVSSLIDNDITCITEKLPGKTYVQLYHGALNGCQVFNGNALETPYNITDFGDFDYLMMGDIHKFQYMDKKEHVCYCGSMIQQNRGESIFNHGCVVWDLKKDISHFVEVQNDYCFLKVIVGEESYKYDTEIIEKKKYLTVNYICSGKSDTKMEEQISRFEKEMENNNIKIIKADIDKSNKMILYEELEEEMIQTHNVQEFIVEYLLKQKQTQQFIDNMIEIHKKIESDKTIDTSFKSNWVLKKMEFKNIFSFGNDKINEINFDEPGFYKIFANNFSGKTSIVNAIKWCLYGNKSQINEKDILHKNSEVKDGYVKCFVKIGSRNLEVKKLIKPSKKVSGITVDHYISYDDVVINGTTECESYLYNMIGSYDNFELSSSINSYDLGLLRETKTSLKLFEHIFRLDIFEIYQQTIKEMIKEEKKNYGELKVREEFYNEDYEMVIKQLNEENNNLEIEKQNNVFNDDEEMQMNELKTNMKELNKSINDITLLDIKNYINRDQELIELKEQSIELENQLQQYDIEQISMDIKKCNNEIKQLNRQIINVSIKDDKELKSNIKENRLGAKKCLKKKEKYEKNIVELEEKISFNLKNIINMECSEKELKLKIEEQDFNYKQLKTSILKKLEDKKIGENDYNDIIKLLIEKDYYSLIETIDNNKKLEKENQEYNEELRKSKKFLNKAEIDIVKHKNLVVKYEELFIKNQENKKIDENNKKCESEIEILENKIDELNEKMNEYKKIEKRYTNNVKQINDLEVNQENYLEYLKVKDDNDKKTIEKQNKIDEYEKLAKEYHELSNKKNEMKIANIKITNRMEEIAKTLVEKQQRLLESNKIKNEIVEKSSLLDNYKEYQKLVSDKGLPSIILKEKIPIIEGSVNEILKKYTNFVIKIKLNGNGSSKKLLITQTKNNKDELTIKSCSGYEMIILNIAFKLAIKKNCYINTPNFICIDECLEKISVKNYNKMYELFDMLKDNYKNILVISHIEEIKSYIEENYPGKHIKIARESNYSYLI